MPTYVEIPSECVPIDARGRALVALREHYERLRPPWGKPALVWVDDEQLMDQLALYRVRIHYPDRQLRRHSWSIRVWGWANTDSSPQTCAVYLNVRQPLEQIARTVAHEVRHHWQYQTGREVSQDDAHRYAGDGPYRDARVPFGPDVLPTYA